MVEKNNIEDGPHKYLANHIIYDYYSYVDFIVTRAVLAGCMANMQDALAKIVLQQVGIVEKALGRSDLKTIINKLEIITLSLYKLIQTVEELKYCIPPHDDSVKCSKAYCLSAGILRSVAKHLENTNPVEPNKLDNLIMALEYLSSPPILKDLDDTFENTIKKETANTKVELESLYKKSKKTKDEHKKNEYELSYIQKITYAPVNILQKASTEVERYAKRLLNKFYREGYKKL